MLGILLQSRHVEAVGRCKSLFGGGRSAWRQKESLVRVPVICKHALKSTLQVFISTDWVYIVSAFNRKELVMYTLADSASNTARHLSSMCPDQLFLLLASQYSTGSPLQILWRSRPERIDPLIKRHLPGIYGVDTATRHLVRHDFCHADWSLAYL